MSDQKKEPDGPVIPPETGPDLAGLPLFSGQPADAIGAPELEGEAPAPPEGAAGRGLQATGDGPLKRMMDDHFIRYASYVIRDRAIPDVDDGLKPVQRRILFSLHENDDGKFIKVANIVGYCMQFHPHGDASIGEALVTLANRLSLIERQGNFGNLYTGDPAAAARYIECRLTDLAREELFNDDLTEFVPTYDGRKREPVTLPAKIPLLLMLGADGIAVGIATRILPHNFAELLEAQIAILQKKPFHILPDFPQGGLMDARAYDHGRGHVLVRALIEKKDAHTLLIRELPFGATTDSLLASIEDAARKGKIKLKSLNDFTSDKVEIEVQLPPEQDPDRAIEALYAFTQCQTQIASRIVVIRNGKPAEMDVPEILRHNAERLLDILRRELQLARRQLTEELHRQTLVRLFVEHRVYQRLETCATAEAMQQAVREGLAPFRDQLQHDLTHGDVDMLLGIPVRRISLFDAEKNQREIEKLRARLTEVEQDLATLTPYAIRYLRGLLKKHAAEHPRKTQPAQFGEISERELTAHELSVAYDREKGYLGHKIAGAPLLACSPLDKLLLVWKDGRARVVAPPDKLFVDTTLIHCAILDREQPLWLVYEHDFCHLKKIVAGGSVTNREYRLIPKGAKLRLFHAGPAAELYVRYAADPRLKLRQQIFALAGLRTVERDARGAVLTSLPIEFVGTARPPDWDDALTGPTGKVMDFL